MVRQSAGPSSKALGKRPMRNGVLNSSTTPSSLSALTPSADSPAADDSTDEAGSSSLALATSASTSGSVGNGNGIQTRSSSTFNHDNTNNYKRVLRMRRGGLGTLVGTNEIDVNLLDMLKRKGENEPLIPARSVFILTTDSSVVPSASTSEIGLNSIANERYFERPEVIKAYKSQQDIQVPEFWQQEEDIVGGRLRARSGETESYELTDEAYEKRHRKYEMIEKRQRHREKEKLQHEHYKLKERIEQLRTMDPNAFLALPSDAFDASEGPTTGADLPDGVHVEASIGSAATLHEAERRRKVMLKVAWSLEERYRTLLPTERRPADTRYAAHRASASVEPSIPDEDVNSVSGVPEHEIVTVDARQKPNRLKMSTRASAQPTPPPTAATEPSTRKRRGVSGLRELSSTPLEPEPEDLEDFATITASHAISSRQDRLKAGQRPWSSRQATPLLIDQALSNYVSRISLSDQTQYISNRQDVSSAASHKGVTLHETPSPGSVAAGRRRSAMGQADPHLNVIQYDPSQNRSPSRKKKKAEYKREQTVEQANEVPEALADTQYPISTSAELIHVQDSIQTEHPLTPPLSQQDQQPSEHIEGDMTISDVSRGKTIKVSLSVPPDGREPYAQLRMLEQPDEDEEVDIDVIQQPEVNETPTADEPITPPVEQDVAADSIIAETHDTYLVPSDTTFEEPASKRQKRSSTPTSYPYSHPRRELSISMPPLADLDLSFTEPSSLSIIDLHSYEIPTVVGKGRKPKPLPALLATSKHNEEPGRKTGRFVKAFGVEVPAIGEEEFELPVLMISEVLGARKGCRDSISEAAGSDGDPPSFTVGMAHGETYESISAVGRRRSTEGR